MLGLLAFGVSAAIVFVLGIHPFLAVTDRLPARALVVEGWIPDYAIEETVAEFRRGGYDHIFTTGGPLEGGSALSHFGSYAELAAACLGKFGLGTNQVTAVPCALVYRNRTLGSAIALREYCREHGIRLESFNLVSLGAHARRSRLCFRRAFDSETRIGVIAIADRDYDPRRWWAYSEGLKTAFGEPIGFLYAWLAVDYGK